MSSTFEKFGFHPAVQRWFTATFGEPSPPQVQGWPAIAEDKHTLILAPTGSGKTLAAFLWCIDNLFRAGLEIGEKTFARNPDGVHTLYISPLKALNNDIQRNLQEPLKGIHHQALALGSNPPIIRTLVRTGDTPSHIRQSMLKQPPHILITTPESLYLLLTSGRGREMFRGLRYLIVDEIHALSNNKRGVHLSLSLERLMPLCQKEPVRIGLSATQRPLQRIAAFLGGQQFSGDRSTPRPVTIVDCGQRKEMDVKVISPVASFSDLPDATVWPAVIDKLYELIQTHRTTLVFVNMRAQTERVARLLNELHQKNTGNSHAQLALAHHGSISREMRYDIEARLKAGTIPAVIATASLELGIDIGSIDLVVQLESPRSVSSALQRVGRSGHLLSATSKGRLIPLYPSDLDDTVALTQSMIGGEIEETIIPENCLDVLAQQIVAELALRDWERLALFRLVRQSYCYRHLTLELFDNVVDMLAGRFSDSPLRALQPRITWDKVNDRLIARRGARLMATLNGGTIPDRGYYSVYLADSNVKLGEMEEEFVFESRVGNVFFLGNNEWRIDQIQQDRIVVAPVQAVKPRPPFWKGDTLYRDFATNQKIGAFRQQIVAGLSRGQVENQRLLADDSAAANLFKFLERQAGLTGRVPTDRQLVVEWFRDSAGEPHVIVHTCFGARVNGLWAIALAAVLEKRHHAQVQYSYNDDGIIMRTLDTTAPLPMEELLSLPSKEIEAMIRDALLDTPIFSVRFRYNAARALILPRSQPGKRIPLWLQRLRAADLLQVARQYPDFPIVIETYRDCLQDVFDLPSLLKALDDLHRGDITVHVAHTPYPSPMASGLMFNFLASNLYENDRSRLPGQVAAMSSELLAQILSQDAIPTIVTPELIAECEARWQNLAPEFHARDAEDLFAIIAKLAPISADQAQLRCKTDPSEMLQQLQIGNRIVRITAGWIATEDSKLFESKPSAEIVTERVLRLLRVRGPILLDEISDKLNLPASDIQRTLQQLHSAKEVVRGQLIVGVEEETWCDRHNFAELYRRAVATRRALTAPADRNLFYRFLLRWHHIAGPAPALMNLIQRYAGFRFPIPVFEREILNSRSQTETTSDALQEFYELMA
ncbi:MAG TPA: DEAD/DEAH box helicase, partial [bacterium]